jgi:NADPH:quinone reductase-like Zn-dependent oxidoreductase
MKAIICHAYGAPVDVLELVDVDEPEMADDEVVVRVHAASVNPADWHFVRGTPFVARLQFGLRKPKVRIPGSDVAGTVEAVGRNVTSLQVGDEVFGTSFLRGFGAFAELVSVPESLMARKPACLTFDHAAAVPLAASTALQALRDHGRVNAGHKVLIVGASGGVGTFAVQIAKALDAEVTAVCSTRNLEMVRFLGADHLIDYTKADFADGGQRFDLILQAAGTHSPTACRRALKPKGALVQISGDSNNRWIGPLDRMITAGLVSPFVSQRMTSFTVQPNRQDLVLLGELIERGQVAPVIDGDYPLHDVPDAIRHVEEGHTRGKAVVTVTSPTATQRPTHRS